MNSCCSFLRMSSLILFFFEWFILFSIWAASKQFLKSSNLSFLFMAHFLLFCLHHCCLLNRYVFLLLIQLMFSWLLHLILISLIQLLFYFFRLGSGLANSIFEVSNLASIFLAISWPMKLSASIFSTYFGFT